MHLLKKKNVDVKLSASEVAMAPCPFFISSWKLFVLMFFESAWYESNHCMGCM